MRFFRVLWCLTVPILAAASLRAQQANPTWNQPRFLADAKTFYDAASKANPPAGADVLVLSEETSYVFDAEGKAIVTRYAVYKVLTQKGASEWDSTSLNWEPWREERPVIKARVITPDYAVHELDQKTVTDSAAKDADEDIYSDGRVVRAPFPAIAPGSLVEEEDTGKERASFFGAGTATRVYFMRSGPVQHASLVLDAPASLPLRYAVREMPGVTPQRREADGRVHILFEASSLDAYENADSYLPSDAPAYPEIIFSTGASWKEIANSYSKIVEEKILAPEIKPLVARITSGKSKREEKLEAILQYLDREIRYTGIEFGDAAVVPHSPAEVLKHKYGDCKDKSTMLVAMLRAAEIPAYVALLNAGRREDVLPDQPGMGLFDHAIVYVPGSPDIWIDATDQYARLGVIPSADQGRSALIVRPESEALVLTPVSSSQDNLVVEQRKFILAENGPAKVIETTAAKGSSDSQYRSYYADQENKDIKKNLTDYVKTQYLADKLDRFDRSDPADITKPFELVIETNKAKRGFTELDNAVVAIRLESIFQRLPNELQEHEEDEEKTPDAAKEKPKKPRAVDYELGQAFVTEWRYSIDPPLGFRPKPLPSNAKFSAGPAVLTEEFSAQPNGSVSAVIRFDTVKRRFTPAEIKELRKKVVELRESQPILIYFEPLADALMAEGKVRESFQTYRNLIAQHPKEAVHHLQRAKALLDSGLGGAAREEAIAAVKLEPNSALAQMVLGDILQFDSVGRKLNRGSDYEGAAAAYRASEKLDPEEHETVARLAILLEFNKEGERYGPGSKLKDSIAEYRSLKPDQLSDMGLKGNVPFTLFYASQFEEARKAAEELNPQLNQVVVAAEAALHGGAAGLAEARRRASDEDKQKELFRNAAQMLLNARIYPPAADLMEAGAAGQNASAALGFAATLRKLRKHEDLQFKADPAGLMMNFFILLYEGKLDIKELRALSSKNGRIVMDRTEREELEASEKLGKQLRSMLARQGLPPDVLIDVLMQIMETNVEGDDATGYRVTIRVPGRDNMIAYIVKEDGSYRIVDTGDTPNDMGLQVLDAVAAGNLAVAKNWLDWVREEQHLAGGDDQLAGHSFPRLWTKGREGTAQQMKIAAAGLLALKRETAELALPILEPALAAASTESERLNISLALLESYSNLGSSEKMIPLATALEKQYPESRTLFLYHESGLRDSKKYDEADSLAEQRLKQLPKDIDALRAEVYTSVAKENYSQALERGRKIVDLGKAEATDLNSLAWYALFAGNVGAGDAESAAKASRLNQNSPSILHTLGSIYAEIGKTKEAHEVLVQAMDLLNLDEPDSNYWYAFGRIAEDYGELDIARENYGKVTKPKKENQIPGSSYSLAQRRLKIINDSSSASSSKH